MLSCCAGEQCSGVQAAPSEVGCFQGIARTVRSDFLKASGLKADRDRPVVVIRADASQAIGGGHVMRCLTLAGALKDRARVVFLSHDLPAVLAERATRGGFAHVDLPNASSARDAIAALKANGIGQADVLVVDHYALAADWMGAMRAIAPRILVIDDIADRPLDCDVIVGPSLGMEAFEPTYRRLAPSRCRLMLGTRYSLVAPAFGAARQAALERRETTWPVRRVLVSTGFTDLGGAAVTAARALAGTAFEVRVAIGSASASMEPLKALAAQTDTITLLPDCDDMANEMLNADIMIGAPGTTSWERATLGLPSLLVVTADNQRDIARELDAIGAARILGEAAALDPAVLETELARLAGDRAAYRAMSRAAAALCDGQGAMRVADAVLELVS